MVLVHPNKELVGFLKSIPFFSEFTDEELNQIAPFMSSSECEEGAVVCREGEPGGSVFFLQVGSIEVHKTNSLTGKVIAVALFSIGTVLGEVSFSDMGARSATLIAGSPCHIVSFDEKDLAIIANESPLVAVKFWKAIARQLSARYRESSDLFVSLF